MDRNDDFDEYLWIAWLIASKIFYLNYSLSFYFYVLTSSYFRHHFLLAIRCKTLHGMFFKTKQRKKTHQSFQTTDFISKQRPSRVSASSKLFTKACDFNFLYQPHQQDLPTHVTTTINEPIPLCENHRASVVSSHV
jgi:hypothetical protein